MTSKTLPIAAFAAFVLASAAGAQDGAAPRPAPDPEKKICRAEKDLGSNIPKRICRTRAEWDQMARDAEETMRQRGRASNCGDLPRC